MSPLSLVRAQEEGDPAGESAVRISVYGATDTGVVREENQDAFAIVDPAEPQARERKGVLAVIADGMGGLAGGATASRIAIDSIRDSYNESELQPPGALKAAVCRANLLIHAHAEGQPEQEPMGSTATAIAIIDRYACVAHVGDSRAYRLPASGPIIRLTRDHTWVEELAKRGELDPKSLQYSLHRNVLTRGLGLREEVEVDLVEIDDVGAGDSFLICSDGLHEMVEDVEIETRLRARGGDLRAAAADLIGLARDRGGPDNITVVIARADARYPALAPGADGGGADHPAAPRARPHAWPRLFPRAALLWLSWFATFGLGVGTVLLLEERPPRRQDPVEEILEDPGYRDIFGTVEGQKVREALLERLRRRPAPGK